MQSSRCTGVKWNHSCHYCTNAQRLADTLKSHSMNCCTCSVMHHTHAHTHSVVRHHIGRPENVTFCSRCDFVSNIYGLFRPLQQIDMMCTVWQSAYGQPTFVYAINIRSACKAIMILIFFADSVLVSEFIILFTCTPVSCLKACDVRPAAFLWCAQRARTHHLIIYAVCAWAWAWIVIQSEILQARAYFSHLPIWTVLSRDEWIPFTLRRTLDLWFRNHNGLFHLLRFGVESPIHHQTNQVQC